MENKTSCYDCIHKGSIPGDAHIRCKFNWSASDKKPPKADPHGRVNGWYYFPINFDPAWQQEECSAFQSK